MALESIPFDLRRCVKSAVDVFAARSAEKGLELALLLAPEVPATVLGDPGRLRQVLLNLISNAIKFTDRGEVVVSVTAEPAVGGSDGVALAFEVRDTGIGIAEKDRDRLFQVFVQADTSTTRRHDGTGLGLATCQRLVSLMGGKLTFESRPGCGTTMRFQPVLPRAETAPQSGEWLSSVELRGVSVLVVDDNATTAGSCGPISRTGAARSRRSTPRTRLCRHCAPLPPAASPSRWRCSICRCRAWMASSSDARSAGTGIWLRPFSYC